ncbi:16S rRNA (guanine(527)-N(7))-methyltransferase RsmG [Pollutibacter soli]|uniref:16S rRNA (guanine(527)-N(7))-methyltransferase RsmG n=1 Tax=Pollutibacter soli TaxID=3034157 RepID=UPI003013AAD4
MEETQKNLEIIFKYFSEFSPAQTDQLSQLQPLYKEWNERINVISRKDIDSLYEKHVLHSLAIAAWFDFTPGVNIIDIGTGGGFPGIPLAIFFPQTNFLLVDSIGKKIMVVNDIAEKIGLKNVETRHCRAEDVRDRKFDFAVSRAVAPLKELWKWAKPLLTNERKLKDFKNGLICLKGGDLAQEIAESRLRPHVREIQSIFPEPEFEQKYILYTPV